MSLTVVLLTPPSFAERLGALVHRCQAGAEIAVASDGPALEAISKRVDAKAGRSILISFGTGVIVGGAVLGRFTAAYNIHAAPPDFPGRDPHHFAAYAGVRRYGATAHGMVEMVDAGEIVGTEWVDVPEPALPHVLAALGNEAGWRLAERLMPEMLGSDTPLPATGDSWGPRKTTRRDFMAMCRLPLDIGPEEFFRRLAAFQMPGHDNLTVELHGYRFRIEGPV